jgi:hypothetical protein
LAYFDIYTPINRIIAYTQKKVNKKPRSCGQLLGFIKFVQLNKMRNAVTIVAKSNITKSTKAIIDNIFIVRLQATLTLIAENIAPSTPITKTDHIPPTANPNTANNAPNWASACGLLAAESITSCIAIGSMIQSEITKTKMITVKTNTIMEPIFFFIAFTSVLHQNSFCGLYEIKSVLSPRETVFS